MLRWVVGSIPSGGSNEPFLIPPNDSRLCKGRGMCYHVCGMVHLKYPLLLIETGLRHVVAAAGFLSCYLWSLIIVMSDAM